MKLLSNLKKQATGFLEQYKQRDPAQYAAAQQAVGGLLILDGFIGIDNPFAGKKRPGIFGTLAMVILGGVFMLIPTFINGFTGMDKMTAKTNAEVVAVGAPQTSTDSEGKTSTTCGLTVKYTVDGKQYRSGSSSASSTNCQKAVGQTTEINYNPSSPNQWMNDRDTMMLLINIFFFVGLFVLLSGVVTSFIRLLSIIFGWKILRSGRELAKSLPNSPDLGTMVEDVKRDFKKIVFGFNDSAPATPIAPAESIAKPAAPATQPVTPEQTEK